MVQDNLYLGIELGSTRIKCVLLNDDGVVCNGFSDWAFQGIPTSKKEIYYRLSRRENDFLIEFSFDGKKYYKMRVCHLLLASGDVDIGMYVASPNDSSFEAEFSNLSLTTCVWKKE